MSWRGVEENDEATVFVQWIDSDPLDSTSLSVHSYGKMYFIMHITKGESIYQMFRNG
jgi:hypothetical protein